MNHAIVQCLFEVEQESIIVSIRKELIKCYLPCRISEMTRDGHDEFTPGFKRQQREGVPFTKAEKYVVCMKPEHSNSRPGLVDVFLFQSSDIMS